MCYENYENNLEKFFGTPEKAARILAYHWETEEIDFDEIASTEVDEELVQSIAKWLSEKPMKRISSWKNTK